MTLIEHLFHWAPDGGSGSLETLCFVVAVSFVGAVVFGRRVAAWSRPRREPQR